jgi:hypothetical protein
MREEGDTRYAIFFSDRMYVLVTILYRHLALCLLSHCPCMRRRFRQWPMQLTGPLADTEEGIVYLQQLTSSLEDFADSIHLAEGA